MNVNSDGVIDRSVVKFINPSGLEKGRTLRRGDVLFNNTNSAELVGKTALFEDDDEPAFSNHMTRLRVDESKTHPAYVSFLLHLAWREGYFALRCKHHVGQASIGREILQDFPIQLPPIGAQEEIIRVARHVRDRRIVSRGLLSDAQMKTQKFRRSVLNAAFSGQLTSDSRASFETQADAEPAAVPDGAWGEGLEWEWSTPDELRDSDRPITYGVIKLGPHVQGGVPILRSSNVRWLQIESGKVKEIAQAVADDYQRTYLRGRELVVTVRGSLGGVAVVPADMAGWNVSREVAVIPLAPEVNERFVAYAIASPQAQDWMANVSKGVTYTGVNIRDLKRLPIPVPPEDEQAEIVKRIDQLLDSASDSSHRIHAVAESLDRTQRSVLAAVLRGGLN